MMDNLIIRPATTADIEDISTLILHTIRESNSADYAPDIIDSICENFSPEKVHQKMKIRDVFVCFENGKCVGTVSLEGCKLHSLFVDPDLQNRNIGKILVLHLESHASSKGEPELILSSSITARPFYERMGYELIRFEERDNGSTYLMKKQLSSPA